MMRMIIMVQAPGRGRTTKGEQGTANAMRLSHAKLESECNIKRTTLTLLPDSIASPGPPLLARTSKALSRQVWKREKSACMTRLKSCPVPGEIARLCDACGMRRMGAVGDKGQGMQNQN